MDLELLRVAYQEAQDRVETAVSLARATGTRRSPADARRDASGAVSELVAGFDGASCRRLAAAMALVVNQDVPENLQAWYDQLDEDWARKVVRNGSEVLLDKALELISSAGKSLDSSWEPAPEHPPAEPAPEEPPAEA